MEPKYKRMISLLEEWVKRNDFEIKKVHIKKTLSHRFKDFKYPKIFVVYSLYHKNLGKRKEICRVRIYPRGRFQTQNGSLVGLFLVRGYERLTR